MTPAARKALEHYFATLAGLNGVTNVAQQFAVAPGVQQKLESRIQESDAFLRDINIVPVTEMEGEKVGLGVSGPIASRTDTSGALARVPRDVHTLDGRKYRCEKTNYDTAIKYATIDAWAKFADFQTRLRDAIIKRQALDRIMTGFNGVSAAATTDLAAYPLLQDVNKGWLEHIRTDAAARHIKDGASAGEVKVNASGGDYKNLDALVYDASHSLLDPWYRDDPDLRVILSRDLATDYTVPLIGAYPQPTEREALQRMIAQSKIGGIASVQVPFLPERTILITALKNLSIYYQDGARRRHLKDVPERDCIQNFESSNDAYVVEDYGMAALISNIALSK